ncbi:ComEA family DNA-binding protein [Desulfobulbus alkaliphilus]|uniref:ComEA family DNA-binding protein n=1 Tax=Desulfobulbus alkaliphilus TaxID=869814 RepID=UPI0019635655|nr:ComEA family DNA-binding protein [Desulfobulbus alkaliphilus]MBM9538107.1 ComEA family DNA-binding protein [Desulfobulbus alkaliphilus]
MKKLIVALMLVLFLATAGFARVNINTANGDELATLPGIGQVKAESIIEYRTVNGDFKSVADLTKVSGIGDKTLERIKDNITIDE